MAKAPKPGINIEVDGLEKVLKHLTSLGPDANAAMRDASGKIAGDEADALRQAGAASDRQSKLVAAQIRVRRDRVPAIMAGGSKKLSPSRKIHRSKTQKLKSGKGKLVKPSAGDVFFGAEFGGRRRPTTQQFRPHRGRQGYWFYPQIRKDEEKLVEAFAIAVDEVLEEVSQA